MTSISSMSNPSYSRQSSRGNDEPANCTRPGCTRTDRDNPDQSLTCAKCKRLTHFVCTRLPAYQLYMFFKKEEKKVMGMGKKHRKYVCEECCGEVPPEFVCNSIEYMEEGSTSRSGKRGGIHIPLDRFETLQRQHAELQKKYDGINAHNKETIRDMSATQKYMTDEITSLVSGNATPGTPGDSRHGVRGRISKSSTRSRKKSYDATNGSHDASPDRSGDGGSRINQWHDTLTKHVKILEGQEGSADHWKSSSGESSRDEKSRRKIKKEDITRGEDRPRSARKTRSAKKEEEKEEKTLADLDLFEYKPDDYTRKLSVEYEDYTQTGPSPDGLIKATLSDKLKKTLSTRQRHRTRTASAEVKLYGDSENMSFEGASRKGESLFDVRGDSRGEDGETREVLFTSSYTTQDEGRSSRFSTRGDDKESVHGRSSSYSVHDDDTGGRSSRFSARGDDTGGRSSRFSTRGDDKVSSRLSTRGDDDGSVIGGLSSRFSTRGDDKISELGGLSSRMSTRGDDKGSVAGGLSSRMSTRGDRPSSRYSTRDDNEDSVVFGSSTYAMQGEDNARGARSSRQSTRDSRSGTRSGARNETDMSLQGRTTSALSDISSALSGISDLGGGLGVALALSTKKTDDDATSRSSRRYSVDMGSSPPSRRSSVAAMEMNDSFSSADASSTKGSSSKKSEHHVKTVDDIIGDVKRSMGSSSMSCSMGDLNDQKPYNIIRTYSQSTFAPPSYLSGENPEIQDLQLGVANALTKATIMMEKYNS